jgi:Tetracyclin repressor-like, C-terminal domain
VTAPRGARQSTKHPDAEQQQPGQETEVAGVDPCAGEDQETARHQHQAHGRDAWGTETLEQPRREPHHHHRHRRQRHARAQRRIAEHELDVQEESQVIGVGMGRYVLEFDGLATAKSSDVIDWLAPVLQRYLTGKLD